MIGDAAQRAERVRALLLETARAAYEDAAIRGLCCEGAWEVALTAIRTVDLAPALADPHTSMP